MADATREDLISLLVDVLLEDEQNVDVATNLPGELTERIRRAIHTHNPDQMMFHRGCVACEYERLASQ